MGTLAKPTSSFPRTGKSKYELHFQVKKMRLNKSS